MATSVEKVHDLLEQLRNAPAQDGQMALVQTAASMALPMVVGMIPQDPAELDDLLTRASSFIASLRSDEPSRAGIIIPAEGMHLAPVDPPAA